MQFSPFSCHLIPLWFTFTAQFRIPAGFSMLSDVTVLIDGEILNGPHV
jgi:hypothetical protein